MRYSKVLLFLFFITTYAYSQHGAYIAPVMKFTKLNEQSAIIAGGKAGWIINKTFVIGGAFYSVVNNIEQSWIDPVAGTAPYVTFNCGGLNFEYIFLRSEPFSMSLEMFMGGAGLKLLPKNKTSNYTPLYGGDFLIWEPQLNANMEINDWLHLSLGINYRTTSLLNIYIPNKPPNENNNPNFDMKNIRGTSAVLSLIFGMY